MADYTWKELAQMLMAETNPQTNYHGSGRLFDRFENSYINPRSSAHGVGHYSADTPLSAGRYVVQNGKPLFINGTQDIPIKTLNEYWALSKDVPVKSPYLYKVNVPNEYFMLDELKPLSQQSPYVKQAIQGVIKDIPNRKFYINDPEGFMRTMNWNDKGRAFYQDLAYLLGRQNKNINGSWSMGSHPELNHGNMRASALLHKYGIQGIRGAGLEDGLLNVTFSGDNIRMANTPWQRFVNRIPTQTLSMIGEKIMATPGVKPTLDFLGRASIPSMIYKGLNSPLSDEQEVMNNYNAVRGLPLQGGIKYYGE